MLVRLVYASRASEAISDELLDAILDTSRSKNPEHGVTGILCVCPEQSVFLQALEGSRVEVNNLYNNIVADPRHEEVTLLSYHEIEQRRFASWRMGRVDIRKINPAMILRYSERPVLDPFSMTAHGAMAFLEELADTAAIGSRERS